MVSCTVAVPGTIVFEPSRSVAYVACGLAVDAPTTPLSAQHAIRADARSGRVTCGWASLSGCSRELYVWMPR